MNDISAPSVVFRYGSIEQSIGEVGSLQLTRGQINNGEEEVLHTHIQTVYWLEDHPVHKYLGLSSDVRVFPTYSDIPWDVPRTAWDVPSSNTATLL